MLLKSKAKQIVLTVVLGSLLFGAGCPAPLSFSGIRNPNVAPDGAGGAIVTYQINEGDGRVTYVQRFGFQGNIFWGEKGITLYSEPGRSEGGGLSASIVNGGDGSVILVWEQSRSIWAQKLDSVGRFLWAAGNVHIIDGTYKLEAVSDGSGGVIVVWVDSEENLYLQRINDEGNVLWPRDAFITGAVHFDLAGDESGNVFLVWQDKSFNVFTQKVDSGGKVSWVPGGLLLSEQHGVGDMQGIVSDETGGAIAAWVSERRSPNGKITGQDLYTQRIGMDGTVLWQVGGIPIWSGTPAVVDPHVVEDGTGGAFIFWKDPKSIYAQRVDADGNILWTKEGLRVWKGEGPQSPSFSVVGDDAGGAIVVWRYVPVGGKVDENHILSAQRIGSNGQKLWGDNGTLVSAASTGYSSPPQISRDGSSGVIIAWASGKNVHNASSSYIQRISAEGRPLWGEAGVKLNP